MKDLENLNKVGKIELPKLKASIPALFRTASYYLGPNGEVDAEKIPVDVASRLDSWLMLNGLGIAEKPKQEPYVDRFREETEALRVSENKRIRDERAASARLQQYVDEQGLLNNEHNANAITKFINEHSVLKGRFTSQAVDIALDFLGAKGSNTLQWRPKAAAPPPPPPQPVRRLPNGEPELPLDANQFQMRRASVEQLRDLDARRRASKPHSSGWHGAKF
jgi:hypothetical protein